VSAPGGAWPVHNALCRSSPRPSRLALYGAMVHSMAGRSPQRNCRHDTAARCISDDACRRCVIGAALRAKLERRLDHAAVRFSNRRRRVAQESRREREFTQDGIQSRSCLSAICLTTPFAKRARNWICCWPLPGSLVARSLRAGFAQASRQPAVGRAFD
jgi:hypothetical protein